MPTLSRPAPSGERPHPIPATSAPHPRFTHHVVVVLVSETLPLYLIDALREFEADTTLQAAFGQEFSEGYLKLRWEQWNEYQRSMSAWEVDATLDC